MATKTVVIWSALEKRAALSWCKDHQCPQRILTTTNGRYVKHKLIRTFLCTIMLTALTDISSEVEWPGRAWHIEGPTSKIITTASLVTHIKWRIILCDSFETHTNAAWIKNSRSPSGLRILFRMVWGNIGVFLFNFLGNYKVWVIWSLRYREWRKRSTRW